MKGKIKTGKFANSFEEMIFFNKFSQKNPYVFSDKTGSMLKIHRVPASF